MVKFDSDDDLKVISQCELDMIESVRLSLCELFPCNLSVLFLRDKLYKIVHLKRPNALPSNEK